ncbi:hypothetical protein NUW58_g10393 [Xylaria curta]|uniref:Uncharacterized protein n=1 Tax=Xylaria curta TaxID=42375 RepID=A0ACC1ML11_9PEZI|nr:hypothetical protein NUW58_g10393 [Xylaria curta]
MGFSGWQSSSAFPGMHELAENNSPAGTLDRYMWPGGIMTQLERRTEETKRKPNERGTAPAVLKLHERLGRDKDNTGKGIKELP